MYKFKIVLFSFVAVVATGLFLSTTPSVSALDPLEDACSSQSSAICDDANSSDNVDSVMKTIVNTLLYFVGLLSVIMIIYAGIQYTISTGDTGSVTRAKNTLVYSVVGLVVAFLSYAIINFVLDRI